MDPCDSLLAILENNLRHSKSYIFDFETLAIDIGSGPSVIKTARQSAQKNSKE